MVCAVSSSTVTVIALDVMKYSLDMNQYLAVVSHYFSRLVTIYSRHAKVTACSNDDLHSKWGSERYWQGNTYVGTLLIYSFPLWAITMNHLNQVHIEYIEGWMCLPIDLHSPHTHLLFLFWWLYLWCLYQYVCNKYHCLMLKWGLEVCK